MAKFRSKVVEIEAIQWKGKIEDFQEWIEDSKKGLPFTIIDPYTPSCSIRIKTLEGDMLASPNDWIIKGTEGEFYPCKPSVFERKYEPL